MSNTLADATAHIKDILDEVLAVGSRTTDWNADSRVVQGFENGAHGKIASITTSGLGDMSDGTYPVGSVTTAWEDFTLPYDRGARLSVGKADLMKSGGVAQATTIASAFIRQAVIPEVDACRVAQVCTQTGTKAATHVSSVAATSLAKGTIVSTLRTGLAAILDDYGADSGCTIHLNAKYAAALRSTTEVTQNFDTGGQGGMSGPILGLDGNAIVTVPSSRMYDAVTTNAAGGFTKSQSAKEVAAVITAPGAVQAPMVINDLKLIPAEDNQTGSGAIVCYEVYHGACVPTAAAKGVYVVKLSS